MTNNPDRGLAASAELDRIAAELMEAKADLDLLERLKSAADRVARLTGEHEKGTKALARAKATEAKAEEANRFAHISDIQVTEHPETVAEHVVRSSFTISYTRLTWDGRATAPAQHSVTGFGILPPDVMDYLIERHPERIPAKIMALASDNPREAFARYFVGLRRGCLIGDSAVG